VFFPGKSGEIPDRAALTLVVLPPEQSMQDRAATEAAIEAMTREYGASARTFKSALVWCVPDSSGPLKEEAKKLLAWEEIHEEESDRFEEAQKRQLVGSQISSSTGFARTARSKRRSAQTSWCGTGHPALEEWSTKAVRDAFFASPLSA
jgi:hypothetical protein